MIEALNWYTIISSKASTGLYWVYWCAQIDSLENSKTCPELAEGSKLKISLATPQPFSGLIPSTPVYSSIPSPSSVSNPCNMYKTWEESLRKVMAGVLIEY